MYSVISVGVVRSMASIITLVSLYLAIGHYTCRTLAVMLSNDLSPSVHTDDMDHYGQQHANVILCVVLQ